MSLENEEERMRRYDKHDVRTHRNATQTVLTGRRREKKMAADKVSPRVSTIGTKCTEKTYNRDIGFTIPEYLCSGESVMPGRVKRVIERDSGYCSVIRMYSFRALPQYSARYALSAVVLAISTYI